VVLRSTEFRGWEVGDDYIQLLDRTQPASAGEVSGWANSALDLLAIEAAFAGTPEFQLNG
jgi:hypothetical protein